MKIFAPMQIAYNQRTLEQNRQFHWVVSPSLYIRLSTGEVELQHDVIADVMESLGDLPFPDMGMPKPNGEWLLNGALYAPQGTTTNAGQASVTLNGQNKTINVFGDRHWQGGIPSKPAEFESMPLDYQHAFGGAEFANNPVGNGYKTDQLPNLESSQHTITSNNKAYAPACFAPMDPSWPQRMQYQGTYDQHYLEKFFPGYPQDMDWKLFMTSQQDQWIDGFFKGNESFELKNMHPQQAVQQGQLPGLFPRCFIKDSQAPELEQFKEVDLHLDTIWFFPDKDIIQLIWRGGMTVQDDEAEQISHMLLAYESQQHQRREGDHYRVAMERRINDPDPLQDSLNTSDLIPLGAASAMQLLQQSALENAQPSAMQQNLDNKAQSIKAAADEKVEETLNDLKKQLDNPAVEPDQRQQILDQLALLDQRAKANDDSAVLLAKLEEILPGLTSDNPKDLDLSDFSFKKIDEIFSEIDNFTAEQKAKMLEQAKPQIEQLTAQLNDDNIQNNLSDEQRELIQQQLDGLLSLGNDESKLAITELPRLDIKTIKQQVAATTPEIDKAKQELHLMLSNPLLRNPDAIQNAKDKLEQLQKNELAAIDQQLEDAKQQFIESYAMGAHFADHGLSPHADDDIQKNKLLAIMHGDKNASGQDWACLDLSGQNLDGMDFSHCLMEQVNLTGASLIGANFEGAVLARANLNNANCTQANFNNANIGASQCHNTRFDQCEFNNSKLSKADFTGSSFIGAHITQPEALEIKLNDCDFSSAKIKNLPFLELTMSGNDFSHAELETCNFVNSEVSNCKFEHSKLPSTAWANTSVHSTSFQHADMNSNCFVSADDDKPSTFSGLDFTGAKLEKANFSNLPLRNSIFSNCEMESANFSGADLSNSNFDDCMGHKVMFRKANLDQASMKRANLMEAVMAKAIITHADLDTANLYGVDFLRATVNNNRFDGANLDAAILKDWRPS